MKAPENNKSISVGNYYLENIEGEYYLHYTGGEWSTLVISKGIIEKSNNLSQMFDIAMRTLGDQKENERKEKLAKNKAASADVLAPVKELRKIGECS